jgi:UDP-N-acetyl-D-mannosaminuronic acid dehydrogenase
MKDNILIIGGLGHIGLPLGLIFANKGHDVCLYDKNQKNKEMILNGHLPFIEEKGNVYLTKAIRNKKIVINNENKNIKNYKHIIICIGTPIDEYLNPKIDDFLQAIDSFIPFFKKSHNIIIRSSIFPGVIDLVYSKLKKKKINNLTYCPERIVQGKSIVEIPYLPQIVSGYNNNSIRKTSNLFLYITKKIIVSSVREAELIKLFSNTWRYLGFSIANQFMQISEREGINYENLRLKMIEGYERNKSIPKAGFAAGPCLLKDTMQLSSFSKDRSGIFSMAMLINEGFTDYYLENIKSEFGRKKINVGILGMAFKQDVDDIRDSLSFKLKKQLELIGYQVICSDYNIKKYFYDEQKLIKECNVLIIAVPHQKYKKIKIPKGKFYIDTWGIIDYGKN